MAASRVSRRCAALCVRRTTTNTTNSDSGEEKKRVHSFDGRPLSLTFSFQVLINYGFEGV